MLRLGHRGDTAISYFPPGACGVESADTREIESGKHLTRKNRIEEKKKNQEIAMSSSSLMTIHSEGSWQWQLSEYFTKGPGRRTLIDILKRENR